MAKRFTKPNINWEELKKRINPDEMAKYLAFKGKSDLYYRRVLANPEEPPKIEWERYKKTVPVPGLVEQFEKEYSTLKVAFPTDTMTAKVDEQWNSLQGEIKKFCAEQQKCIDESQKQLDRVNALPKFDEITMEMFYDLYPETAVDFVKRPSFWPHTTEEQPGYETAEQKAAKAEGGGH